MRLTSALVLAVALCLSVAGARAADEVTCPVSGKKVTVTDKTAFVRVNGERVYFCCNNCPKAFAAEPQKYINLDLKCPVSKQAAKIGLDSRVVLNNELYYFCCGNCPKAFATNTANFVKELRDPVTGKAFKVTAESPRVLANGQIYLFADPTSKATFEKDTTKYVTVYK